MCIPGGRLCLAAHSDTKVDSSSAAWANVVRDMFLELFWKRRVLNQRSEV